MDPPFTIRLAPWAAATADDLHRAFGDDVHLTVGVLPYPPDRRPERPAAHQPAELLDPEEVTAELDGVATIRSGHTLRHRLLIRNLTRQALQIATNGPVTASVVDPETGEAVGSFVEPSAFPSSSSRWHQAPLSASRCSSGQPASRPASATPCPPEPGASRRRCPSARIRATHPGGAPPCSPSPLLPEPAPSRLPPRAAGELACRPGSVHPLTRAGGHPSGTAVAGSLLRSTREHRAGRPLALAQETRPEERIPLLTLLRVGFT
jgi:hypothetical protein